ncbi:response regulator [Chromobacterium alticapitis]|uniref:Response regulator n=1 Tax=Chromobacterium alticapitis TaxID=2073169 RepID=A0A2S5DD89_9NEIS|nr:response regulator [Chromobacterium alticapitis]POZ61009.1 response regulator [Chromobacterium alticapitis]
MRQRSFLIVDDSPAVLKRLGQILESLGHLVVGSAGNGLEAIAKARDLRPDVITMDIQMPEMSGLEATRHILSEQPDQPIIIITAHGQESTVVDAIAAGAKYFICKPIEREQVAEVLNKVFRDD